MHFQCLDIHKTQTVSFSFFADSGGTAEISEVLDRHSLRDFMVASLHSDDMHSLQEAPTSKLLKSGVLVQADICTP